MTMTYFLEVHYILCSNFIPIHMCPILPRRPHHGANAPSAVGDCWICFTTLDIISAGARRPSPGLRPAPSLDSAEPSARNKHKRVSLKNCLLEYYLTNEVSSTSMTIGESVEQRLNGLQPLRPAQRQPNCYSALSTDRLIVTTGQRGFST